MITGFRTEPTQDVDAMIEADAAAEWERINDTHEIEELVEAGKKNLDDALAEMNKAVYQLLGIEEDFSGTTIEDKIASIRDDLDNLTVDLRAIKTDMERWRF